MNALAWFVGAVVLASLELLGGDFALIMLSGGALAAAGVSLLHAPLWLSVAVFALVSLALLFIARPFFKRRLVEKTETADFSPQALVGTTGETIERISGSSGIVKIDGSLWSARSSFNGDIFETGEYVVISHIEGNTAFVIERRANS
ncbi:NfeD family protein [Corynebacterium kroppenstedtii]|uniref:NfeD family protein n=1 Tax=Corynebacterium sp. PCR 32 TaxID=3351342 RepID=UPI00309B85B1